MGTSQIVLGFLGTGSVAAILGAIISGLFSRKKLGADATEIITKAASGVVDLIKEDNARLREEVASLMEDREELRTLIEEHTRVLQLHAAWDALAVAKLRDAGINDLPSPPPMYHPNGTPAKVRATLERTKP